MAAQEPPLAEVFALAFKSLKKKERDAFFQRLIGIKEYRESLIELALQEARKKGPRPPLRERLAEKRKNTFS